MAYTRVTPENAETTYQVVLHRMIYSMTWREIVERLGCNSISEAKRHFKSTYGTALQHHVFGKESSKKLAREDALKLVKLGYPTRTIARTVRIEEGVVRELKKQVEDQVSKTKPKRRLLLLTINGQSKTVAEVARESGLTRSCIYRRLGLGWDVESITLQRRYEHKGSPRVMMNGKSLTLLEWSIKLNIPYGRLYKRYRKGLSEEKILQREPITNGKTFTAFGTSLTIRQWAERTQIPLSTLYYRLGTGMSLEGAVKASRRSF